MQIEMSFDTSIISISFEDSTEEDVTRIQIKKIDSELFHKNCKLSCIFISVKI